MQAGGFISARAGSAPGGEFDADSQARRRSRNGSSGCIGCGACAAACPNRSAMLFTAAKVSHLSLLPQGNPERARRVLKMVRVMDAEGFGNCTNTYECEAVCPAEISASFIAKLNREYARAQLQRVPANNFALVRRTSGEHTRLACWRVPKRSFSLEFQRDPRTPRFRRRVETRALPDRFARTGPQFRIELRFARSATEFDICIRAHHREHRRTGPGHQRHTHLRLSEQPHL